MIHDCSDYVQWLYEALEASSMTVFDIMDRCMARGYLLYGKEVLDVIGPKYRTLALSKLDYALFQNTRATQKQTGVTVITYWDTIYPARLKEIFNPPAVLYAMGNLDLLNASFSLGIVGTRNPSEYGKKAAYTLSKELAAEGICIVSGFAMGIDACAHRGAVEVGSTIAVLGCGVDCDYPVVNRGLRKLLMEKGLILSEFPIGTQARNFHFPLRNRIISGLSRGVIVVEAAPKSGSLITSRLAMEQNRDVFAIPGEIFKAKSQGCNQLIREGATLISSTFDILQHYGLTEEPCCRTLNLTKQQQCIYDYISGYGQASFDDIYEVTQLDMGELMLELFQLEMMKVLELRAGNHYSLI
jgi:DNA processing protein